MLRDHLKRPKVLIVLIVLGIALCIGAYFFYYPVLLWLAHRELTGSESVQVTAMAEKLVGYGESGMRLLLATAIDKSFPHHDRTLYVVNEIICNDDLFKAKYKDETGRTLTIGSFLGETADELLFPALLSAVESGDSRLCGIAFDVLSESLQRPELASRLDELERRLIRHMRHSASSKISLAGVDPSALASVFKKKRPAYQYMALKVISEQHSGELTTRIRPALKSNSALVKRAALDFIAKEGGPEFEKDLIETSEDPSPDIARSSIRLLGWVGAEDSANHLLKLMEKFTNRDDLFRVAYTSFCALTAFSSRKLDRNILLNEAKKHWDNGAGYDPVAVKHSLLSHKDPDIVIAASRYLGSAEARVAIPDLIALLEHPDIEVRITAVEALGRLRVPEAVEALIKTFSGPDLKVRLAANRALILITCHDFGLAIYNDGRWREIRGDKRHKIIKQWEKWREDNRDRTREEWLLDAFADFENTESTLIELLPVATERSRPLLMKLLDPETALNRRRYILLTNCIHALEAPDERYRVTANYVLEAFSGQQHGFAEIVGPEWREKLAETNNDNVARKAVKAWKQWVSDLRDGNASILSPAPNREYFTRPGVAETLSDGGDPAFVIRLFEDVEQVDSRIRTLASKALSQLARRDDVEFFNTLLAKDNTPNVRREAAGVLLRFGGETVYRRFAGRVAAENSDMSRPLVRAMKEANAELGYIVLRPLFKDRSAVTRIRALVATAELEWTPAVVEAAGLLLDEDPEVRYRAAETVRKLTGQDFGWSEDATPKERQQVAVAVRTWFQESVKAKEQPEDEPDSGDTASEAEKPGQDAEPVEPEKGKKPPSGGTG
ncbi:MAG: hypothetical protein E3J72_13145 [Planctomycetota bacterium]|nr:MAG: hypothetical protein E3J72_13145 [Planctomycetota bacterium]